MFNIFVSNFIISYTSVPSSQENLTTLLNRVTKIKINILLKSLNLNNDI